MRESVEAVVRNICELSKLTQNQPEQVIQYVRCVLLDGKEFKPADRSDWKAVDRKMAATFLLHEKACADYEAVLSKAAVLGLTKSLTEQMYHVGTYRQALAVTLLMHTEFIFEGVYRDGNADWYYDRLFSAIEGTIKATRDERMKELEKRLAKVRSFDRQAAGEGHPDSEGRKGSERPESRTAKAGE